VKRPKIRLFEDASISGVNIVPVIDLCLVLLVILLIISPMLDNPPLKVQLPQAKTKEEKENNIAVTVTPDGKYALNSDMVEKENLPKFLGILLKEQGEDTAVVIRSDKEVQYGQLTELLKVIKTAGAKKISLGTDKPKDDQ